jgi:hypothetical protein
MYINRCSCLGINDFEQVSDHAAVIAMLVGESVIAVHQVVFVPVRDPQDFQQFFMLVIHKGDSFHGITHTVVEGGQRGFCLAAAPVCPRLLNKTINCKLNISITG